MSDEPKLTVPQRRYEIIDGSDSVYKSLSTALGENKPAHFDVRLADIYKGELPVPDEIQTRKVGMQVLNLTCNTRTGSIEAKGHSPDNSLSVIDVSIPSDRELPSILRLLDVEHPDEE